MKKMTVLVLSSLLIFSLGACSKDKDTTKKATTEENAASQNEQAEGTKEQQDTKPEEPRSDAELASDVAMNYTKLVKVFSISQRMHENYQELGPFFVIRGVEAKGRIIEVWVNDGKVYEIK